MVSTEDSILVYFSVKSRTFARSLCTIISITSRIFQPQSLHCFSAHLNMLLLYSYGTICARWMGRLTLSELSRKKKLKRRLRFYCSQLLIQLFVIMFRLRIPELRICPFGFFEQFAVRACLYHFAVFEHGDHITEYTR